MPLLTTTSTLSLISTFKEPIINSCKELKKEISFFLDNGLVDYINSIKDKFQYTKTFLYRQENVNFYDVFFPVSINIGSGSQIVTSCENLFSESNFVSIIGSAGSGKTMLMKHFFLESIEANYRIPLFIELRNLNDFKGNFTELIYEVILNNKLSPDKKILERLLESGNFILLLDGYDEIYSDKKDTVTSDLDKFIDRYSKNRYIISSRPGTGIESMPRFNNYPVMALNQDEIFEFIDLVLSDNEDVELGPKIKNVINRTENKDYKNFLSSPLLLSMFILTFKQYPELPKKKSKFYWNVFDTLATKHDSFTKKGGYQHERKSGLQHDEFEKILQWFSYRSLFDGKFSFDSEYLYQTLNKIKKELSMNFNITLLIDDLTVAISILIIDGIEYKFPHKSIQEYFAVNLVKDLKLVSKQKIYQIQFRDLELKSTGGSLNLWSLSMEIDELDFNKYFIIHHLKEFHAKFYRLSNIKKIKEFYNIWDIKEGFEYLDNDKYIFNWNYIYTSTFGIYKSLFSFLNLDSIRLLGMIGAGFYKNEIEFSRYLDTIADDPNNWESFDGYDDGGLYFSPKHHWNNDLEILLKKCGVIDNFSEVLDVIKKKIDFFEIEIQEEENASLNLLGIN